MQKAQSECSLSFSMESVFGIFANIPRTDQTKPTCKRCETGRFVSHGYEPYMEFVNETDQFGHVSAQHRGVNHRNSSQSAKDVIKADPTQPITPRVSDETRMAVDLAYALDSPNISFRHPGWMISVLQHPETPRPVSYSVCAPASVFIGTAMTSLVLRRGVEIYYKALRLQILCSLGYTCTRPNARS